MTTTFTTAVERDHKAQVRSGARPHGHQLLLALTSIVAMMIIGLSYAGRTRAAGASTPASPVNLNTVTDAAALEDALQPAFSAADDRHAAATRLLAHLQSLRKDGGSVANVGAIRALFTAEQFAAIKPHLIVRSPRAFRQMVLWWAGIYFIAIWGVVLVWRLCGAPGDHALLGIAHLLTAIGFAVVLSRTDPLRDTTLFVRYTQGITVGCLAFAALSLLDFRKTVLATFTYVPLVGALCLSTLLLLLGSGPVGSNARVNLGPIQPVEAIRLMLGLFLAGYFARRWELLRQIRGRTVRDIRLPTRFHFPRFDYLLPVTIGVAAALVFFFLQRDLGPALFVSCVFLAIYAIARNRIGLTLVGLGVLAVGFYAGYVLNISTTLTSRVLMWQSAWDNMARGGDQIAQAIWALSTGGTFGTGIGLGDTRYVPAGFTDLPFAAIGEELGFIGLLCVIGAFLVLGWRGFSIALRATNDYAFFLATTLTMFLVCPVLLMTAGMLGVVPLTGVVTPFVSFGGSAMVANFAALGILVAVERSAPSPVAAAPFAGGVRWLASTLAVAAVALVAVLLNVQVLRADTYVVKPHLGLQADGGRRYQYNPRLLDAMAQIPRGTVYDRNGLALATSDPDVIRRAAAEYKKRGIDVSACDTPGERCYPLGAYAFHLLGDVATRRNWGASNTSYVERDLQDRMRGFDDHAAVISVKDVAGRSAPTIRRDYQDLLPLLRHRHQPGHPAVTAFLAGTRDVTLTIDAPLQVRVARILAKYAARTSTGRAAAVVIDPDTGELLASVSYPLPAAADSGAGREPALDGRGRPFGRPGDEEGAEAEAVFDRARYGLYAPGSTFKLVTAVAALRLDRANWNDTFICARQDQGRVGARIPGYSPVRDDVLDVHPHGSLTMRDAIVQSCNAYFAQLAVRLGPRPLLDTAALVGVSVAHDNSADRLRATLPYAGYGQGDVVATPLRMARVAAAIADGGLLRDVRLERPRRSSESEGGKVGPEAKAPQRLLSPDAAQLLTGALRDAVLVGTGRSLAGHQWRIAGKTGTAEVSNEPSHAWFIGFAPYDHAEKKIAFAVLIEHAGYGGAIAAPAAGEIVSAAAARGLVR